jgi:hypothetical protein
MYSFQSKSESIIFIPRRVKAKIYIYSSQLISIARNPQTKQNVIRDAKTRYIMWTGIKYNLYSFQSKSDSIIFIPQRVESRLYICSSQLISIGMNAQAKQNVVIRDVKTRYMFWPGVKYPMYSFQSKCDSIIFIPRPDKARVYIWFTINFNRIDQQAIQSVVIRDVKTRYMLCPGIKYAMYSFQSRSDSIIFIPRHVKTRLYIYSSQLIAIGTNSQAKQNVLICDVKTRYMLFPAIKYSMYSFQSKSDSLLFILRRVKSSIYIYISQLISIGANPQVKEYVVIRDAKTRYMLWPGKKYCMYSFQSESDSIIFTPRRVKARLYI